MKWLLCARRRTRRDPGCLERTWTTLVFCPHPPTAPGPWPGLHQHHHFKSMPAHRPRLTRSRSAPYFRSTLTAHLRSRSTRPRLAPRLAPKPRSRPGPRPPLRAQALIPLAPSVNPRIDSPDWTHGGACIPSPRCRPRRGPPRDACIPVATLHRGPRRDTLEGLGSAAASSTWPQLGGLHPRYLHQQLHPPNGLRAVRTRNRDAHWRGRGWQCLVRLEGIWPRGAVKGSLSSGPFDRDHPNKPSGAPGGARWGVG